MKKTLTITAALVALAAGAAGAETRAEFVGDRCTPAAIAISAPYGFDMQDCVAVANYYFDLHAETARANAWSQPYQQCVARFMSTDEDPNITFARRAAVINATCR